MQDVIPIQREFGDFVPRGDEQFVSLTRKKKAAGVIPATLCPIVAPHTIGDLTYSGLGFVRDLGDHHGTCAQTSLQVRAFDFSFQSMTKWKKKAITVLCPHGDKCKRRLLKMKRARQDVTNCGNKNC